MKSINYPLFFFKIVIVSTWVILLDFHLPASVSASDKAVLIAPTRVVLEGRTRATTVKLINPNNRAITYKISLVPIRMDEQGIKTETQSANKEEKFAQGLIRFSPRRATIPPNGWQTIRLMVRKPGDLPEGEYRTHLKISPVPKANSFEDKSGNDEISVKIEIVFNVSIPVIVRHGKGDVKVTPRQPQLVFRDEKYFLQTHLQRNGKHSVFADVKAFFVPNSDKERRELIGEIKGISIYAQNENQVVYLPVKDKEMLTNGKVEIEIINREKKGPPSIGFGKFDLN